MRVVVALVIVSLVGAWAVKTPLLGQELIVERINSIKTTWKAGVNVRFQGLTQEEISRQMGALDGGPKLPVKTYIVTDVPGSFDCRHAFDNCPSVSEVRDQGSCGSCWAFGAVEAMTDRYCIHYNQTVHISAEDLNSCCTSCGNGCGGGSPSAAWDYWVKYGLVTGGQYNSSSGCQPYLIKPCDHSPVGNLSACSKTEEKTPKCSTVCRDDYPVSYRRDTYFGKNAYSLEGVWNIQSEIMTNGPVEGTMDVYEDFLSYKTGVYRHETGNFLGSHGIRILGWGEEITDSPYWTVANSWNTAWGDNGFFQIFRGNNEVKIESGVVAGMPG